MEKDNERVVYSIGDVKFINPAKNGKIHWQDVVCSGECIGALGYRQTSTLAKLDEWYQKLVPESIKDSKLIKHTYISEDKGYLFAVFSSLEDLIEYCNTA